MSLAILAMVSEESCSASMTVIFAFPTAAMIFARQWQFCEGRIQLRLRFVWWFSQLFLQFQIIIKELSFMNTERCFTKVSSFGNALSSIAQSMFVDFVRCCFYCNFLFHGKQKAACYSSLSSQSLIKIRFKIRCWTAIIISRFFRSVKKIFYVFSTWNTTNCGDATRTPQDIVFFKKHFRNSSIHLDRRVHMLFVLEFSGRNKPLTCNI